MKTKLKVRADQPTGNLTVCSILFSPQAVPSLALIAGHACPETAAACRASTFPGK